MVVGLAGGGALYWYWPRPAAPSAAELLPDTTLFFARLPDFPRARADFANTPAGRLCQEPEVQALLAVPQRAVWEALGGKVDAPPETLPLLDAIRGELFVALTKFTALPKPSVNFIVGADLKEHLMETKAALAYYAVRLHKYNPAAVTTSRRLHGVTYHQWTLSPQVRVSYAFLNSMLVASLDEDTLRETITWFRHREPDGANSLAASARYQNISHRLPANANLVTFLNVEYLTAMFGPLLMLQPQGLSTIQKMSRIQGTALGSVWHQDQFVDTGLTTYSSAPPNQAAPTTRASLAFTATNTMLYVVQSTDWGAGYQTALDAVATTGLPKPIAVATQFERDLRRQGIRPQPDFFAQLGPETALLATWRDGTRFPDMALVAQLRETNHLDAVMNALANAFAPATDGPAWETVDHLRILRLGSGLVAPTYFVTNQFLVIASTPDFARELRTHTGNLTTHADFQTAMNALPGNAASYLYCDTRALVRPLLAVVRANFPDAAVPLPSADALARHLGPYASATVPTPQVETTTTLSPLSKPLTLAVGVAGLYFAVQPYLTEFIPMLPKTFSGTTALVPPTENRTAPSQTPTP